ncbi:MULTISPECIES: GNAT family N-acetyltransferase [Vibrio]|uniref:GNAT family N-acetyltransferase n=1 Tax=Vibrio algicola TaxID=2662262 RepID=A0A5Q0TFH1_9VIBR|nr:MULTISPECIES: GNAT family N-acetyltransferase [Vibrio]MBD1576986.1 GNAT family N-acetyltransferase [Vibrio sp. S11_S32]
MPVTIRSATNQDLECLNELMYQLHDHHHQAQPELFKTAQDVEQEKSIARYIEHPECLVFVAEKDQKILGFITGHFCELISSICKPLPMGSIDEFFILPEHRNTGVSVALFERIESTLFAYGVVQLFVEVWDFNQAGKAFYNKMEFESHIHYLRKSLIK